MIVERRIQIVIPKNCTFYKFDSDDHGLSYCMKAVDWIIETPSKTLFLEIKDPDDAPPHHREKAYAPYLSDSIDKKFVQKFRDTWMYRYGLGLATKPIIFLVLISMEGLSEESLLNRNDGLKHLMPLVRPQGPWVNEFAESCGVFNLKTWNRNFPTLPAQRV